MKEEANLFAKIVIYSERGNFYKFNEPVKTKFGEIIYFKIRWFDETKKGYQGAPDFLLTNYEEFANYYKDDTRFTYIKQDSHPAYQGYKFQTKNTWACFLDSPISKIFKSKYMKIYFIRHSESQDDLINCYGGASDWDLTENGAKKIEEFRPVAETFGVEKFFTSPLKRAYKTAEILNKNIDAPIEKIFGLRETNHYGYLTGLEKNLAKELFEYLLEMPEYQNASYYGRRCMPGGETPKDLDTRVGRVIKSIIKKSKGKNTIAIVTHGGVLRSIFLKVLKEKRKILEIGDVAFAEVSLTRNKFAIEKTQGFKFE